MLTPEEQQQYLQRNAILRRLGFSSYDAYLASAIWKAIRHQVLLSHTRCRACGKPATQVHHNRYRLEDLNGACFGQLIPVCARCHRQAEFTRLETKLGPQRATEKLDTMRVEQQKIWRRQDYRLAWDTFFAAVEDMRIFIGMDASAEAQGLVEQFDRAFQDLPARGTKPRKSKKR